MVHQHLRSGRKSTQGVLPPPSIKTNAVSGTGAGRLLIFRETQCPSIKKQDPKTYPDVLVKIGYPTAEYRMKKTKGQ